MLFLKIALNCYNRNKFDLLPQNLHVLQQKKLITHLSEAKKYQQTTNTIWVEHACMRVYSGER